MDVEVVGRDARAVVLDRQTDAIRASVGSIVTSTRVAGRRVPGDVVEEVRDDRVEQNVVDEDERQVDRRART